VSGIRSEAQTKALLRAQAAAQAPEARARRSKTMKAHLADPAKRRNAVTAMHAPEARKKAAESNRKPLAERFARHTHPEPNSGCWLWSGARLVSDYGILRIDGRQRFATHVSLELYGHPRPFPKAFALHSCDNPICVNPDHLRWGTAQDNVDDAKKRGRLNTSGLKAFNEARRAAIALRTSK
jgi:hypothetical protein